MADIQGIDVSRWQGTIDWDTVDDHAGFAIIKAGGSDKDMYTDTQFVRNQAEARRVGIDRGYYYYAGGGDPIKEAEHFVRLTGALEPGEIMVLDFEVGHPDPVDYVWHFLVRTEELTGIKPLLYTNMNRVWSYDWKPVVDNGNQLWGAIYDGNPLVFPSPGPWTSLAIKQFTNQATLPGISGSVDMNVFPGIIEDFRAMGMSEPDPLVVDKLELETAAPVVSEPVPSDDQSADWTTEVRVSQDVDPNRKVGIVPADHHDDGTIKSLTLKLPVRRPAFREASFEMDFAAALDS